MRKIFSFMLAILMVITTVFTGTTEVKADTGTVYEPYYDAGTGQIIGAPEVGTVLTQADIISGSNLTENVDITMCVHVMKEEITDDAYGYNLYDIAYGQQKQVSEMKTVLDTGASGLTVAKVDIYEYDENKSIVISVHSNDAMEKLENLSIELDWSKFDAEIGGVLDMECFTEGFIKHDKFKSKVGFLLGMITVTSPDGTEETYNGADTVIINAEDNYTFEALFMIKDGYYVEVADESIIINDDTVNGKVTPYTGQSSYWTTYIVVPMDLGTGTEIVERIKNAQSSAGIPNTGGEENKESEEEKNDYSAILKDEADVVSKIELTDAEKAAIAGGEKLEVVLNFEEVGATATTEEQKAIVKELGNKKIGTFLEIDLTKKIGISEVAVSKTTGLIEIAFELPAELKNTNEKVNRTYAIMRYHDGKVEVLDTVYDAQKGVITFKTDKFSTYAVVYEDSAVAESPKTGDATTVAMYTLMFVCVAGLIVVSRKQNRI